MPTRTRAAAVASTNTEERALPRLDSLPPPDSIHESETKVGDLALAFAEAQRAAEQREAGGQPTAKVDAFDLEAALAAQKGGEPADAMLADAGPPVSHERPITASSPSSSAAAFERPSTRPGDGPAVTAPKRSSFALVDIVLLCVVVAVAVALRYH